MRALSTILLSLLVIRPAAAQVNRRADAEPTWHLMMSAGSMRGLTVSDKASHSAWVLSPSHPFAVSIDRERGGRAFGLRVQHVAAPLDFQSGVCTGCDGTVRALSVMATFRNSAPLFESSLRQMIELGLGSTTWHSLTGRNGDRPPSIDPTTDFSYSAAIGIELPIGDRVGAVTMYDILMARHQQMPRASGAANPSYLGLSVFRLSLRILL